MQQLQVTSLSSKGQVVIPNDVRQSLGVNTGSKFLILTDGDHLLLKPIQAPKFDTFKALIQESKKVMINKSLRKGDIQKLIKKVRHENRS